jgi:hypothetical protein
MQKARFARAFSDQRIAAIERAQPAFRTRIFRNCQASV